MYQNQVRYLVDSLELIILIECKWIFKTKIGANGQIDTFKTRLAVKGINKDKEFAHFSHFSHLSELIVYVDCANYNG